MARAPDADVIRLTLPPDPDLAAVVTVAVRVVGLRCGLSDREVDDAQAHTATAFGELAVGGATEPVDVELHAAPGLLQVRLRAGGQERSVRAPST